ncbi:dihydrodipicolinate synthase/N-acetylneuraminate lyase [Candidatus Scalindua japonica]|uniref:Dihydrodipicolinate synthase/N-acetylneuraminate lyase n=1 Tax=Candidatus Scalindua japonica TaxID=1284222 RepID=A0A286TXN7_9BACT|nr:dihydrodipicolinate synthase family protein [Candidatus Scalindua japonica]GAX60624.1 dihydrodipicolinate synthase/N-acetylneuraminate lyase [Candidatus Scalindua japonica]
MKIEGVFPPVTTPFDDNGCVAHNQLEENINRWNDTDVAGYLILGSNSESVFLTEEEKLEVVKTARKSIPPSKIMLAGTGLESTENTIEFTKKAADCGADVAVIITPHFFKSNMSHDAFMKHYLMIADISHIPVLLYNVPAFTSLNMGARTASALSSHENIIGIKDSSGNVEQLSEIISLTAEEEFCVLTGSSIALYPSLCIGASGGIMAIACAIPEKCSGIIRLYKEGNHTEAKELQLRLIGPSIAVTSLYGVPGLKAAMDLFGYHGGLPRLPLLPVTEREINTIKDTFMNAGFL